jgi:hypothetical protein
MLLCEIVLAWHARGCSRYENYLFNPCQCESAFICVLEEFGKTGFMQACRILKTYFLSRDVWAVHDSDMLFVLAFRKQRHLDTQELMLDKVLICLCPSARGYTM